MKLLLTSNGLSNPSIAKALFDLVGKPATETSIVFIPTAMNVEAGDKNWFVNDLYNINKQGLKNFDIVDISALPKDIWLPRIEAADVLFFSGGNTFYLMQRINESGLAELLPGLLKTRVWAGISAGSMVTNPTLTLGNKDKMIYYEESFGTVTDNGLGFVNFYTRPHFNSPNFPKANQEYLENMAKDFVETLYALDDGSALKIIDGRVEVITEGKYLVLNEK